MFNIYTLLYLPIIIFVFFWSLLISTSITIKYDKRYEKIEIKYSLIDNILNFFSGNYILLILSFIPFINILLFITNIFSFSKFRDSVIESRIERGSLKRVDIND